MANSEHMNTDYHNRLELEVSSLKHDNIMLQTRVTQLEYHLKQAKESNEQLRQAIAVLNDEPTNSL